MFTTTTTTITTTAAATTTPWNRGLPENLTGPQLLKKFPAFYGIMFTWLKLNYVLVQVITPTFIFGLSVFWGLGFGPGWRGVVSTAVAYLLRHWSDFTIYIVKLSIVLCEISPVYKSDILQHINFSVAVVPCWTLCIFIYLLSLWQSILVALDLYSINIRGMLKKTCR
jgi:hypothetical protein